jgi:uncharacterized OB-fold protein
MSQAERELPTPAINVESAPFWQAANDGELHLKKCDDCGDVHFYPRSICPFCASGNTSWLTASGDGEIYTFSIMRAAQIPYAIAYVTLPEGPTIMSNIVDCDFADITIGAKVKLAFRISSDGQAIPVFTLT